MYRGFLGKPEIEIPIAREASWKNSIKKELSGRVLAEGCRVDPSHSD
jgi:hypothetical protein